MAMRIEVLVLSGAGPVYEGVLRLGDVTVLTGRNDSGKTRVLRSIEAALMSRADAEELEVLGVAARSELDAFLRDPECPPTGIVAAETATVAPFTAAVEMPAGGQEMRVGLLISPWSEDLLPGWRYGRALIDMDEGTRAELEDALEDASLDRKDPDEPLKLEALGGFDPQILPEAIVVPCSDAQMDLRIVGAIIRLTRALRALASVWGHVADVAGPLLGGPPPEWASTRGPAGEPSEAEPSWEWLLVEDEETDTSHVHPAARQACVMLERIVTRLLPSFIAEDYRLRIIPGRPTAIARGHYIDIQLHRRSDGENDIPADDGEWFDVSDAASGFTVWIQLAFFEAVQRVRRFSYLLQQHVLALHLIIDQGYESIRHVTYSAEEVIDGIPLDEEEARERDERVAHRLDGLGVEEHQAALENLLAGLQDPRLALPIIPEHPIFQPDPDREFLPDEDRGESLEPMPRGRLYLLDEPEQRLHPMLQRRAAQWLGTLMSQWEAQCVITTHSVAFMAIPGDTFTYEIVRTQDDAKLLPLDSGSLTPYSQIAQEMGLDRGELLSLTTCGSRSSRSTTAAPPPSRSRCSHG
jgi:energy-coupling factor transporter ATP-binding protein EcfA2